MPRRRRRRHPRHHPEACLDPLLVSLNTIVNNTGVRHKEKLCFYTTNLAYKCWVEDCRFFVTRVTKMTAPHGPEPIPLLSGGCIAEVCVILKREPFFLTAAEVKAQWPSKADYDPSQFADPYGQT